MLFMLVSLLFKYLKSLVMFTFNFWYRHFMFFPKGLFINFFKNNFKLYWFFYIAFLFSISFFFHWKKNFFNWMHLWHMDVPGPGAESKLHCDLCHSCGNSGSLTHWTKPGIKPMPPPSSPLLHSGTSSIETFYLEIYLRSHPHLSSHNFKSVQPLDWVSWPVVFT